MWPSFNEEKKLKAKLYFGQERSDRFSIGETDPCGPPGTFTSLESCLGRGKGSRARTWGLRTNTRDAEVVRELEESVKSGAQGITAGESSRKTE